jgi:hypothetical protein
MDDSELSNFSMLGYKMAEGFSCKIHKNGRVCILVKDNISYEFVDLHCMCKEKIFEACAIIIQINNTKVCILCHYRAPIGNINNFIDQLEVTLKYLECTKSEFIICGYTNIDYFIDNYKKEQLQRFLNSYNLIQVIDFPNTIGPTTNR